MTNMLIQPKGSVAIETNKQTIARVNGVKQSAVALSTQASLKESLDGIEVLFDAATQDCWLIPDLSGQKLVSFEAPTLITNIRSLDLTEFNIQHGNFHPRLHYDFSTGFTLVNGLETVVYEGVEYHWAGEFSTAKVVPAGSTPESTGGIGDNKWMSTLTASTVLTESGLSVETLLNSSLRNSEVTLLSVYYAKGIYGEEAFLQAYTDSTTSLGLQNKVIINDTPDYIPITIPYTFKSIDDTAYHFWNDDGVRIGVIGKFKFGGTGKFYFDGGYEPYVNIILLGDGTEAAANPSSPLSAAFAVQCENQCIAPTILINGRNYKGWLFGSLGRTVPNVTKVGVQSVRTISRIVANRCGGELYVAGCNGFGFFGEIFGNYSAVGCIFKDAHDVVIQNFMPGGKFKFQSCTSVAISNLLMGPSQNFIYGCTGFYVNSYLGITSQTDPAATKQTKDVYSLLTVNSIIHFGRVRLYGPNCGIKFGNYSAITIDNAEGVNINQWGLLTDEVGDYTGLGNTTSVSVRVICNNIEIISGNTSNAFTSKSCFAIKDGIPAELTLRDGRIAWNTDGGESNPSYAVYGGNNSSSKIIIDNVTFAGTYSGQPVYLPSGNVVKKLFTPGSEVNIGGVVTTGNGTRLLMGWGIGTENSTWNMYCSKEVRFVVQLTDAVNSSFIVTKNSHAAAYIAKTTGQFSGGFTVSKGDVVKYSIGSASIQNSYAELIMG